MREQSEELRGQYFSICAKRDYATLREMLQNHPELTRDERWLQSATRNPPIEILKILHEFGLDLNFAPYHPDRRLLDEAASAKNWAVVRWLVENGAAVNYAHQGEPRCRALFFAIMEPNMEMVRLLVEAGARLDVCGSMNITPLSWAISHGHQEVVDYLLAKGAILSEQAANYRHPPIRSPMLDYLESQIGQTKPLIDLPVLANMPDTLRLFLVDTEDAFFVVTDGMSNRPMQPPEGVDGYQRAELAFRCGDYFPRHPADWNIPEVAWVLEWMIKLAEFPFTQGIWFGKPYGVISNEEPPQPLSEFTAATCWALFGEKDPFSEGFVIDNQQVVIYTLYPIHTDERDFVISDGLRPLLERFNMHGMSANVDPTRRSVISDPPPLIADNDERERDGM
ncbi:suppressor of fused domain protein [Tuwongella immobilis]|uniref:Suppressor of fused-like domain-containing protein n=1 Tax=Tuwongella immobilis TaxID=692036 RepID=A0A6C2YTJ2_9BACT|nr:suppressor of fused domain protein [Tuwongella immobilis]VIP04349.1 ankyrin repeat-containing protein : Uncharacterized protein OS=Natrinema gari JCM 14663 GN=C486_07983 PE=4 SV=1: Ank_2: SUFU [Tuwongella immobilis]VTS06060.1 ankyrin repeat-containing protein : Uncharacterized protein OS=Natrinema gari JCM 14663 GN=C486_07983 PE=4 SV=1: Ank_2: SUFU [Tuwongella immobilis]